MEWRRGEYEISTDSARLDLPLLHSHLSTAYWSEGVPLETVTKSIEQSIVFGAYIVDGGALVGFARVVTDYATFAWICDVFVFPDHRGRGLGKWLMECIVEHPDLQGLRRLLLATRDAHGLYEQFGFEPVPDGRFMQRRAT